MSRAWGTAARCEVCSGYHEPAPTAAAPVVLQAAKVLDKLPSDLGRTEAPRLLRELEHTRITHALAEQGGELLESVLIRFRHGEVAGFAAWHNGAGQGVYLLRPMLRRLTVDQLRIELGFVKLVHVTCELPNCFQSIRATQAGRPRAHKNRAGKPCTLGRALLASPWFVGPLPEGES